MSVLEGTSAALQRKDEVHRLATVNRSVRCHELRWLLLTCELFVQVQFADKIVVMKGFLGIISTYYTPFSWARSA